MALPLPKVIADTGPGGGLVTAMGGMNALSNAMLDTQINKVKAQYAPLTTQAEAASKLAYANLMGPQFLAKLMGNSNVVANSPELQDPVTVQRLYQAGMGGGAGNALMQLPGNQPQKPSGNSLSSWMADKIKGILGGDSQQPMSPSQSTNAFAYGAQPQRQGHGADNGYSYDARGNNVVASPQEIAAAAGGNSTAPQVNLGGGITGNLVPEVGTGYTPEMAAQQQALDKKNYFENAAQAESIIAAGKELGTERGKAIADLGKQQLDLSNSGIILDRLTKITQNPEFQKMRDQIPFYQDKQLWWLSKNGTKAQQDAIGDLVSTAQAFKASTVNSFKGKALEKEFNLADKIKIDENDTGGTIQGKLRSLRTLKDIAESKNNIILGLMSDKNMNLGEATKIANKTVDTSSIEKQVDNVLNPQPAEHDIQYMMKKRNLPRTEIIKQLKAKGYNNVS